MKELWAIIVALPHERQAILPLLSTRARIRGHGFKIWEGEIAQRKVLLMQSGMGVESAKRAGTFLVEHFPITHLLATGYCGALTEELKTGDVVWTNALQLENKEKQSINEDPAFKKTIESSLKDCKLQHHRGALLTCQKAITKVEDKKKLKDNSGAIAVDMETFPIFEAVQNSSKKISFLSLRFVLDAAHDELAPTDDFISPNGQLKPFHLAKQIFKRPPLILELQGMGHKAAQARNALSRWIRCFFKKL